MHHVPFGNSYFATDECGGGPYNSTTRHCYEQLCVGTDTPPADCFGTGSPLAEKVVAQHGVTEYEVNRLEACAWHRASERGIGNWATWYWPYVVCLEKAADTLGRNASTAQLSAASAFCAAGRIEGIESCFVEGSAEGDTLVRRMAAETPDHPATPWITVNGQPTTPDQVLAAVCKAIKGPAPAGCSSIVSPVATTTPAQCA